MLLGEQVLLACLRGLFKERKDRSWSDRGEDSACTFYDITFNKISGHFRKATLRT